MALSASAKDYLSRFFPGPPSPLWETDPEFMELFANFALDEVVNQGDLDDAARMMAILAALLGCQGVEEYRVLLPAALRQKTGMDKTIRFVGMGQYLEIWDDEKYAAVSMASEESIEDLLNYVNEQYEHKGGAER